jgi:hypothetical protein
VVDNRCRESRKSTQGEGGTAIAPDRVTETDKLFLFVFEAARPDQVDTLLEISRTKGWPLSMMVVEAMQGLMDSLPQDKRRELIRQFQEEHGIDLEELLS